MLRKDIKRGRRNKAGGMGAQECGVGAGAGAWRASGRRIQRAEKGSAAKERGSGDSNPRQRAGRGVWRGTRWAQTTQNFDCPVCVFLLSSHKPSVEPQRIINYRHSHGAQQGRKCAGSGANHSVSPLSLCAHEFLSAPFRPKGGRVARTSPAFNKRKSSRSPLWAGRSPPLQTWLPLFILN